MSLHVMETTLFIWFAWSAITSYGVSVVSERNLVSIWDTYLKKVIARIKHPKYIYEGIAIDSSVKEYTDLDDWLLISHIFSYASLG